MTDKTASLVAYENAYDIYPQAVSVIYDATDEALPEARKISKRLREYFAVQTPFFREDCCLSGLIRFDGSVPSDLFPRSGHTHFAEAVSQYYCKPLDNLVIFEWQHSTPDYNSVITNGLIGTLRRIEASAQNHAPDPEKLAFLDALEETCHTLIDWAHRCGDKYAEEAAKTNDEAKKAEFLSVRDSLYRVPEYPAESFYEAVQTISVCFNMLSDSIGLIDRYLYPYYEKDIRSGKLTREKAKEILQELFIRIDSNTGRESCNRGRGGECHFAIGGYDENGSDSFNPLSELIAEAIVELPLDIPEISLRWTKETPFERLKWILNLERNDPHKRIALVNDEPRLRALTDMIGLSYQDAVSYTMVGCNEPALPGSVWFGGLTANIARSIANVFSKCAPEAEKCKTYDDFFALWQRELNTDVSEILAYSDYFNRLRAKDTNVLSSLFLDGCIEKAKSATQGGCRIGIAGFDVMGLTCVIDSLTVIKQFVYDEKSVTMKELADALRSDWKDTPELRNKILKEAKFFGNNEPLSDTIAKQVDVALFKILKDRRGLFGERLLMGTLAGYHPHYATFGALTPATPDGRYAGDPFMVGCGQSDGKDREGTTALLSSVAGMDPTGILCGPFVCNVLFDEKLIRDDVYFDRTVSMVESYFKMGGLHIQLNYVSKEELLEARKMPEKYQSLKVRVSGFSGYFTTLRDEIQQNVIDRTVKSS